MIKRNLVMALKSLAVSKQRSILALSGIVIGIAAVIALISVGTIYKENTLKQFVALGTDYVVVSQGWGGFDSDPKKSPKIQIKHVEEMPYVLKSVLESSPLGTGGGSMLFHGQDMHASVLAVAGNFLSINRLSVLSGRFISDLDGAANLCVIGYGIASKMTEMGFNKVLGEHLRINERLFTVVGVLKDAPYGLLQPFGANDSVMIPFANYFRSFDNPEIRNIMIRMSPTSTTAQITEDVKQYFNLREPSLNLEVRTAEQIIKQMNDQMRMITLFLGAVGGISLVVGGVGVMNVMLVSVTERKKEIGLRRAMGAYQKDIQLQFVTEALVLCFVGGVIGIILGVGVSYIFTMVYKWDFFVYPFAIWLGLTVSSGVGLFFGYYPARQASKLDPIQALRSD